jgi:hypothetical protein
MPKAVAARTPAIGSASVGFRVEHPFRSAAPSPPQDATSQMIVGLGAVWVNTPLGLCFQIHAWSA